MGALFDFFLVSGHLARRAVELLSFLGIFVSLVLFSSLLPFAPSLTEERWDYCGLVFGKEEKQYEFLGWPP